MHEPLVSVVMPVYNGEKFLAEAINSILSQTFSDFEFIIINDGSTDRTEEIILSFADERIRYIKNSANLKIIDTLNKGLDLAQGKYIARMDADDVSLPERFAKQVAFMEANPEYGLCGTNIEVNNQTGKEVFDWIKIGEDEFVKFSLLFYNPICHPTTFIRTSLIREHQLHYNKTYVHAEDYQLWLQISKHAKIGNLPDKLLRYRLHDQQISVQFSTLQAQTVSEIKWELFKSIAVMPILNLRSMHLFLVGVGFPGAYPTFQEILYTFRKSGFLKEKGNRFKLNLWLMAMERGNNKRSDWKNPFLKKWLEEIRKAAAIKN